MSKQAIKAFEHLQDKGLLTADQDYASFLAGFKAGRDALRAEQAALKAPATAQDEREARAWPDVAGIGRDSEHPRAVVLYLRHEPSDEHLRTIQEALRTRPAQPAINGYTCTVPDDCETLHWRGQILSMNELASMAQPAEQRAEVEALREERDALQAEIERLRKDAERYRWLRKGESDDVAVVRGLGAMDYGMSAVAYTYSEEIDGDDLDAAIDAELAKVGEA